MKELSIYLETALVNLPLEDLLKQSITSYPWQSDSLKPWVSKKVEPIFKHSEQESLSEEKVKVETLEESQFGLKPTQVKLHDLTQADTLDFEEHLGWHDFELTYVLGKGGMGIVYEGFQNSLKRSVAVKKSKSEQKYLAQIYHEAQITAFLDHPNILPVYDFAIDQDRNPIQVMKKINGVNWSKLLQDDNHLFWQELEIPKNTNQRLLFHLDVLSKVTQAIAYAHEKHVIHRDLKPSNVMIGKFGEVFVLDWGIAVYIGQDHQDQFIA